MGTKGHGLIAFLCIVTSILDYLHFLHTGNVDWQLHYVPADMGVVEGHLAADQSLLF